MRKGRKRLFKVLAGCLAAFLTLGSTAVPYGGTKAVYADAYDDIYDPVPINASTFPDANFRAVVLADFDTNGDHILESREIVYARNLWCVKKGIKSLQGIEYLKELRGIYCMDNQISSWNLSQNKLLTGIWCSGNLFTSLDFTVNPALEWVYAFDCKLTYFNVKNNSEMSYIEINSNPLGSIDVSHNPKLEHLMVGDCGLTKLDVTHNPNLQHLDAFRNKFKSLDLSQNPKMKRLDVWDNPGLGDVDTSNMPGLQYYNCAKNNCTSVDVSKNPELQKLVVSYNRGYLKSLDISHNPKLAILQIQDNELTSLDISHNPMLRFIWGGYNNITKLNIGNNPFLQKIYNEGTWKDEGYNSSSWTIDYGGEDSTEGDNLFILWLDNKVKIVNEPDGDPFVDLYPPEPTGDMSDFITRENMVQTLYEMAGKPSVTGLTTRFDDVEYGEWYTDALLWGEKYSICVGYPYTSADSFGIGIYLNRQDLMLMLMRYAEYIGYERAIDFGRSDDFLDYFDVDYDHWEAVCWAATWRIMEGRGEPGAPKDERTISPWEKATREEILQMINNMYEVNKVNATAKIATPGTLDLAITKQPADMSVTAGSTAKFEIQATGKGTLTYQWQSRKNSSSAWTNSGQSGATTKALSVATTAGLNGWQFRCAVTNGLGKTKYSKTVTLSIVPKITAQPKNTFAVAGSTAQFTVAATGTGRLTYQWQSRKYSTGTWVNSGQTGAKTNTLSVATTKGLNGWQFRCVVTDANGQKTYSQSATLGITPCIKTQPKNTSATPGAAVKFTVAATGQGTLTYQWQSRKDANSAWANSGQSGAKTAALSLTATEGLNGWQFRCIVTDGNGRKEISDPATLSIVKITTQPKSTSVKAGTTAKFTVTATSGTGKLTYQWQSRKNSSSAWANSGQSGAKTKTLSVATTKGLNGWQFRCIITDANGKQLITNTVTLTVK
ncbi:MAG: hypothetical protein IK125_02270 [Lachnospiraceae bacterium]|nr:hypothetical protein [Lachnospiraceae bacterium]